MNFAKRELIDLQSYVEYLEKHDQLIRVHTEVNPVFELAGIAKKFEGGKAVLFEKIKDSNFPVLIGLYWNRDIISDFFETTSERLPFVLKDEIRAWQKKPMEPVINKTGPANEIIESEIDLTKLPIPQHAEADGGRYLTSSVVIAKDPDSGVRNVSIHRMMLTAKDRMTIQLEELGHLMDYYKRAEARGEALEITVSNGVDFAVSMAGAAPESAAPIDTDELGIASQIRGQGVELIEAQTVGVEAIANAQFVIEGRILPRVREPEGPYAEVTGYYAERANRWVFEPSAITRRKHPIFHSILSGKEVYNAFATITEAGIFEKVNALVPAVTAVHLSDGSIPYHLVVQIDKKSEDIPRNVIMAAFTAQAFVKMVTVVDTDVDIFSMADVEWAVATRCRFDQDLIVAPASVGHRLNPSTINDRWTRLGIDATVPLPKEDKFVRSTLRDVDLDDYDIYGR
ncbi:MAG: 2,5-furandicarboxylate decarboxylase 1 [Planctomycetota bacterium]|jgi:2,5-furandicarboxylate decarboxylase 1